MSISMGHLANIHGAIAYLHVTELFFYVILWLIIKNLIKTKYKLSELYNKVCTFGKTTLKKI